MNLVLHFHAVKDINWFEKVIILLKRRFQMINIHQLYLFYQGKNELLDACHITIDDGDISFYNTIFPILKKHNIPATLFVSPLICKDSSNFWFQDLYDIKEKVLIKRIKDQKIISENFVKTFGDCAYTMKCLPIKDILIIVNQLKSLQSINKSPRNINISQLLEIANCNLIEIGAHTLNHPILANEDDKTSSYEISESILQLESLIGNKIEFFAYPNGVPNIDFGEREKDLLKKKGIKLSFSTEPKVFSLKDNPMSVPRLSLTYGSMTMLSVKLALFGYWDFISLLWYPELKRRRKFIALTNKRLIAKKILQTGN